MDQIYHFTSITEAHQANGLLPPKHPLISLTYHKEIADLPQEAGVKVSSDLYLIGMKDGVKGKFGYGRSAYDFQKGAMIFVQPLQVLVAQQLDMAKDIGGWTLLFHPDLLRHHPLGDQIGQYSFFSYDIDEALHLSQQEMDALTEIVQKIERELSQNIDKHTEELIVINLETLLKYCRRYYDRQFYTRSNLNKDVFVQFEAFVRSWFTSERLQEKGLPTLEDCGKALHMSGNYLSDLLRTETGKSAMEHIRNHAIEKAKTSLLNSNKSVSEIAYSLGFNYAQNFSRLFRSRTGMSPGTYRKSKHQ